MDHKSDKAKAGSKAVTSSVCHPTSLADRAEDSAPNWLSLPAETWQRIIEYLLPSIRPEDYVFPHPHCKSLHDHIPYRTRYKDDLLALAAVCKRLENLTLPVLFRAIDLPTTGQRDKFVDIAYRNDEANDEGQLVQKETQRTAWIRSLRVESQVVRNGPDSDLGWYRCAYDTRDLSHVAAEVRFLSLECARVFDDDFVFFSGMSVDDNYDGPVRHPLADFLSTSTTCRPRSWRLSLQDFPGYATISLRGVSSFAPLSQTTHLELSHFLPQDDLLAILVGNPTFANQPEKVQEGVSAGYSPLSKLECLRLSCEEYDALETFDEYATYRFAVEDYVGLPQAQQNAVPSPTTPPIDFDETQEALFNLAASAGSLPNLRLLILDLQPDDPYTMSAGSIRNLARGNALEDTTRKLRLKATGRKGYACSSVSSSFSQAARGGQSEILRTGLRNGEPIDDDWQHHVSSAESYWQEVHKGKLALKRLWDRSRTRTVDGTVPVRTEIRIAARKEVHFDDNGDVRDCTCSHPESRLWFEEFHASQGSQASNTSYDAGSWADPDVFSLVESRPWLPYRQLGKFDCFYWTGELPRDSNPSAADS